MKKQRSPQLRLLMFSSVFSCLSNLNVNLMPTTTAQIQKVNKLESQQSRHLRCSPSMNLPFWCKFKQFIRWDTESRPKVGRWPSKDRICELVGDIHWMSRTNPGHGHAGLNVTSMLWVPTCILAIVHQFQSKQSTSGWMRATQIGYIYFSAEPK